MLKQSSHLPPPSPPPWTGACQKMTCTPFAMITPTLNHILSPPHWFSCFLFLHGNFHRYLPCSATNFTSTWLVSFALKQCLLHTWDTDILTIPTLSSPCPEFRPGVQARSSPWTRCRKLAVASRNMRKGLFNNEPPERK